MDNEEELNFVEQMQSWQEDWNKVSEDFDKPQIIIDAKQDVENYKTFNEKTLTSDKSLKKLDGEFAINPMQFNTTGKDQEDDSHHVRVTDNFSDGKILRKLRELKLQLYDLENEVNSAMGLGKSTESLKKKRDKVRNDVEDTSNEISPDWTDNS